ncbi:MAG: hypothetical protein ACYC1U_11075 [Candidatus Aquicultorales bacterium]
MDDLSYIARFLRNPKPVMKSVFLENYMSHETKDGKADLFPLERMIPFHEASNDVSYWNGQLLPGAFDALLIAYHTHDGITVSEEGEPFWSVVGRFDDLIAKGSGNQCIEKVRNLERSHSEAWESGNMDFLFFSDDPDLAHLGHFKNRNATSGHLFMGCGFHRLIAYGLWLRTNNVQAKVNAYLSTRQLIS